MDKTANLTEDELFVHLFCNQAAEMNKGFRQMRTWYLFSDKRLGTCVERVQQDATAFAEYQKLFRPGG